MPKALSIKPEPYQHEWTPGLHYDEIYTGWAYPPKDYEKWGELVYQWAKHCVEKYGRDEVETWYWEVWNEPNIGYWRGTPEEFRKLHDYAIDAVRRALPTARVGGPDTAGRGGQFMRDFLEHCLRGTNYATGENGTPLDFVSFHAKGAPDVRRRPRAAWASPTSCATIDDGFGIDRLVSRAEAASRSSSASPTPKAAPPARARSSATATARCIRATPPPASPASTTWPTSTASTSKARSTWAFEFEDQPYFAGFRALATNGIDLPVLNVFRMFGEDGRPAAWPCRAPATVAAGRDPEGRRARGARRRPPWPASRRTGSRVLVWHYHDDDVPGPDAAVDLAAGRAAARGRRGAPDALPHRREPQQRLRRVEAHGLAASRRTPSSMRSSWPRASSRRWRAPATLRVEKGQASLRFALPRQAVSLVVLEW